MQDAFSTATASCAADTTALFAEQARLPDGWARDVRIEIRDGCVAAVTTGSTAKASDTRVAILLPGMNNLHSHAFQRAMAGLGEVRGDGDDSFWSWRAAMYAFVHRITPDDLFAIAAMANVEMLESGFTRVGEFHYLHHAPDGRPYADPAAMSAALVAASAETGIGLTLLPVFYARAGFGRSDVEPGQRRFATDVESFTRLHGAIRAATRGLPDAVVGVAPHSLRAVAAAYLPMLATVASDAPVHIHVAEQMREVDECLAAHGARPVEFLLDNAPVDARWCAVHATHMTAAEAGALARSGAVAGLCPVTEANLGDGIFGAAPFLSAGGRYGVGSDSNVMIDATEELRWLEYGQRLAGQRRACMTDRSGASVGDALWDAAGSGGAVALGTGFGIANGNAADFVSLWSGHPALVARSGPALLDALVFAAGRAAIDGVWRRGWQVVAQGRHTARDGVVARYAATLARLRA